MKTFFAAALAAALIASIPVSSIAAPAKHKAKASHKVTKVAATTYQCVKCHMTYSAADAKKDHYKCTMDGGKLVAVKGAKHSI